MQVARHHRANDATQEGRLHGKGTSLVGTTLAPDDLGIDVVTHTSSKLMKGLSTLLSYLTKTQPNRSLCNEKAVGLRAESISRQTKIKDFSSKR